MMAAAKRTSAFYKKVPRTSQHAAGHAGVDAGDGAVYVLHTKEEFEAANGCQVGLSRMNAIGGQVQQDCM